MAAGVFLTERRRWPGEHYRRAALDCTKLSRAFRESRSGIGAPTFPQDKPQASSGMASNVSRSLR